MRLLLFIGQPIHMEVYSRTPPGPRLPKEPKPDGLSSKQEVTTPVRGMDLMPTCTSGPENVM